MGNQHSKRGGAASAATAAPASSVPATAKAGPALVRVNITRARGLRAADTSIRGRSSDPYAVVSVEHSTTGPQSTKVRRHTLHPVWHAAFTFLCPEAAPTTITVHLHDHDRVSSGESLGVAHIPILDAEWDAPNPAFRWVPLTGGKGEVQVQISVRAASEAEVTALAAGPSAADALQFAEAAGLATFKLKQLCTGDLQALAGSGAAKADAHAAQLLAHVLSGNAKKGASHLRVVLSHGLTHMTSASISPSSAPEAATGASTSVELPTDFRVWVRPEQTHYLDCISIFAENTGAVAAAGATAAAGVTASEPGTPDPAAADEDDVLDAFHEEGEGEGEGEEGEEEEASEGSAAAASPSGGAPVAASPSAAATPASSGGSHARHHRAKRWVPVGHAWVNLGAAAAAGGKAHLTVPVYAGAVARKGVGLADNLFTAVVAGATSEAAAGEGRALLGRLELELEYAPKAEVEEAFLKQMLERFDADGSGTLDPAEMLAVFEVIGHSWSTDELEAMLRKFDVNGDGRLERAELLAWLRSPEFQSLPMCYSLLGFLADGNAGLERLVNDITHGVARSERTTGAGAHVAELVAADGTTKLDTQGLKILDRETGLLLSEFIPKYVKIALSLMYRSPLKVTSLGAIKKVLKALSAAEGRTMNAPSSVKKIQPFIDSFGLNMEEVDVPAGGFKNFNEFFARKLKPGARAIAEPRNVGVAVSPADCRLVVYPTIAEAAQIWVKGEGFTVETLLGPAFADVAHLFLGGSLVIARLAPQDYHRWHAPVSGRFVRHAAIDGALLTVSPLAVRRNVPVYTQNKREVYALETPGFGLVLMVAVGATVVGSINTDEALAARGPNPYIRKGECHGYFAFGGSTVLVLFQPGAIDFDKDLVEASKSPLEVLVKVGAHMGVAGPAARGEGGMSVVGTLPETDPGFVEERAAWGSA